MFTWVRVIYLFKDAGNVDVIVLIFLVFFYRWEDWDPKRSINLPHILTQYFKMSTTVNWMNPGNRRKFNTLEMEISLQTCPSIRGKVWQIWLMTKVWNQYSKVSGETDDVNFWEKEMLTWRLRLKTERKYLRLFCSLFNRVLQFWWLLLSLICLT